MSGGEHLNGWRVSAGNEHHVFDNQSDTLCRIFVGGMTGRTFQQGAECARLIASAPDLLEALETLARKHRNFEQVSAADILAAEGAIAKAKGGAL